MAQTDEHLKPLRLFDIAWNCGPTMTEQERQHLSECAVCESMLEIFIASSLRPVARNAYLEANQDDKRNLGSKSGD